MTRFQFRILRVVRSYIADQGRAPLVSEIMDICGLGTDRSIGRHLDALAAMGLLTRNRYQRRSIVVTPAGMAAEEPVKPCKRYVQRFPRQASEPTPEQIAAATAGIRNGGAR